MSEKNKKTEKEEKKIRLATVIYSLLIFALAYIVVIGIFIYGFSKNNALINKTAAVIPYPAAFLGSDFISLKSLNDRTASVKRFYENQDFSSVGMRVDFNTDDGKKRLKIKEKAILNKLIEDKIVEKAAKKRGVFLTQEIISQEVDRKMKEYGSENYLKENLSRLYGWTVEDFENYIVKPDMYREKLSENIKQTDPEFTKAKEKIMKAQSELKSGAGFGETAKKYSEGESAKNSGTLGWFSADQMLPEIAQTAFTLEKGKTSDAIESAIGWHIVKVEDKKNENGTDMVKISQIFVRTKTLGEWLADQEKNLKILIPLKDYYWNKDNLDVEFKDEAMKKFEENILQNPSDDASMMF
jgi:peptidyl-prolyl cis-trans isomerase C